MDSKQQNFTTPVEDISLKQMTILGNTTPVSTTKGRYL